MFKKAVYYISHWEDWHWFAKYIIIGPAWLWFCLKARSLWFFTPSNPTITFGGFIGETKKEIYKQLPTGSYPKSIYISPAISFSEMQTRVLAADLHFPLAVKPNIGMMGLMFRKIESPEQLNQYHAVMPAEYIIQELITYPLEVSIFYYRFPGKQKGHITGFVKKEYLQVEGNGKSTLRELILAYPRAQFRLKELFSKHEHNLETILADGDAYCLSPALNLSRGGRLVNLEHEKDEKLLAVFDNLSNHSGNLYYGRFDIKCASIKDLKQGIKFSILEYNGCGAEPHHVYGNGNSFFNACKILIDHWSILYKISQLNYENGIPHWTLREGWLFTKAAKKHFKVLKELDVSFHFTTESKLNTVHAFSDSANYELHHKVA